MASSKWIAITVFGALLAGPALAQHVISAKSGLIHYTEGEVFLDDKAIDLKPGDYPDIKEGQRLRTTEGRAEVLLTPGVFLRLAENSSVAMVANKLTDTRVEIASGSVILEAGEVIKENSIELVVHGTAIEVRKKGVFRIDATNPPSLRAYEGELSLMEGSRPMTVKAGKQVLLTGVPVVEKFSKNDTDAFHRWAGRRSGYLAVASMSAAKYMQENSISWNTGGWYFNPFFGMFTYVPLRGMYRNYWNYAYYSPRELTPPPPLSSGGLGADGFGGMNASMRGMQDRSGRGYAGGGGSAPVYQAPATSSPAPSAGAARTAGPSSSRGGSGGSR